MKFILTAGGQGTKLWPMSREDAPKQFQPIVGNITLYEYQIQSLLKEYKVTDLYISTKKKYLHFIEKLSPNIPKKNIIIEPDHKRNRGPAEGLAFLKLAMMHPDEPFMIIQTDVLRETSEEFLLMIKAAEKLVIEHRKLITAGQKAIYPDMGSDYLRLGSKVFSGDVQIYQIDEFVERLGDYEKTQELIETYNVSTHANHLCWYPELILNAYERYRPDWYDSLMQIKGCSGRSNEEDLINKIYENMKEGPTEEVTKYVMKDGFLILTPFKWIDIGTWTSIYDSLSKSGQNYIDANSVAIDTKRTLVKSKKNKIVATLGISDLIIVDTDDALLVASKERASDIKRILEELKSTDREDYL